MKKSGFIASSIAAAFVFAISSSSSSKIHFPREDCCYRRKTYEKSALDLDGSSSSEKFSPKFDGLRFIETLVTAHR
ncbi:hypothetical protein ACJIZ3_007379 [Penstemon smallii]|uniref:Uncharacterized protein n=1 Tax=Penstemon smallii TaxID=265156 RepID=A0ABD3SAF1_9LAMI